MKHWIDIMKMTSDEQPNCIFMVGLPGVGKTTLVKQMLFSNPSLVILSTDDYIQDIADANGVTYNDVFKTEYPNALRYMNEEFDSAIKLKKHIVIDQTNLTIKSRAKKLARIPSFYRKEVVVVWPISENMHVIRLNQREGKTIPQIDMDRMRQSFEIPTMSEGFDAVFFHVV